MIGSSSSTPLKFKLFLTHAKHLQRLSFSFSNHQLPPLPLTPRECISLLQSFTNSKSLHRAKILHAYMLSSGLLHDNNNTNITHLHLLLNIHIKLTALYATCGSMNYARSIFDRIVVSNECEYPPSSSSFLWNTMIRGYTSNRLSANALALFSQMRCSGVPPDKYTFPFVLKACTQLQLIEMGSEIHCQIVVSGLEFEIHVGNSLLSMYMEFGRVGVARQLFDKIPQPSVVSWNIMIGGNFQNGYAEEALMVFTRMEDACVEPDRATVVSVLPVCGYLRDLRRGRQVHEYAEGKGFGDNLAVRNSLVDMYGKCGCLSEARELFDAMPQKDVVSWTAMINGYVLEGFATEALLLSSQMLLLGGRPNSITVAALLSACAISSSFLKHGRCVHGYIVRNRLESDIIVETALVDMYAKCNRVDIGHRLFVRTCKGTVPWNAILSGYTRNGLASEAVGLFKQMLLDRTSRPNSATMIGLLPAFAELADLHQGRNMHCYLIKIGFDGIIEITTALIDVYSKSGSLDSARSLFDGMPVKDIVAWSAIIAGYGKHGDGKTAVSLFDQMLQSGIRPNEITVTSILYACSHAGLVDEGLHLFNSIVENYDMKPSAEHYSCIVDLLGRAGRLREAYHLIKSMPFEPNHAVWGALLGASVIHEDVELGEEAAQWLFKLEPENTGNYVLLANMYAAVGRWEDAENIRISMKERGLMKTPGCSSIEARNTEKI